MVYCQWWFFYLLSKCATGQKMEVFMTMHRFHAVFLTLVMTVAAVLAGCGGENLEEKLYGAWKSELNGANGKPIVLQLSKDTMILNGKSEAIAYQSIALNVEIVSAADRKSLLMATGISKEKADMHGDILPLENKTVDHKGEKIAVKVKFVRISEEEAKQLTSEPQSQGRESNWSVFIAELW